MLNTMTIPQRKEFLTSELKSGRIASITWETKSSGETTRNVKLWIEAALASGDRKIVQPRANPREDVMMCVDMDKYNSGVDYPWVTIDLNTLKEVKVNGKVVSL